jgi:hypothetical protein
LVFTFCAIYQHIEKNPPSGLSPLDWLADAKQVYYGKEGKQFIYERTWSFLKQLAKHIKERERKEWTPTK